MELLANKQVNLMEYMDLDTLIEERATNCMDKMEIDDYIEELLVMQAIENVLTKKYSEHPGVQKLMILKAYDQILKSLM